MGTRPSQGAGAVAADAAVGWRARLDIATSQLLRKFEGHSGPVNTVAFSPNGVRILSGSADGTLKQWDATTGRLIRTFKGHSGAVTSIAVSRDGTRVLSGSEDQSFKLWLTETGQLLRTFQGHSGTITSVAFSPSGTRLMSGSGDTTIRLWDGATGQLLVTLMGADQSEWLAISPEGFFAASPHGGEILSFVRGSGVLSNDLFYQELNRPDLLREKLAGDPSGEVKAAETNLGLAKRFDSGWVR